MEDLTDSIFYKKNKLVNQKSNLLKVFFTCLPKLKGMYLYLIMWEIWRLMVRTKRTIQ